MKPLHFLHVAGTLLTYILSMIICTFQSFIHLLVHMCHSNSGSRDTQTPPAFTLQVQGDFVKLESPVATRPSGKYKPTNKGHPCQVPEPPQVVPVDVEDQLPCHRVSPATMWRFVSTDLSVMTQCSWPEMRYRDIDLSIRSFALWLIFLFANKAH